MFVTIFTINRSLITPLIIFASPIIIYLERVREILKLKVFGASYYYFFIYLVNIRLNRVIDAFLLNKT
jgi:hypothetical protein